MNWLRRVAMHLGFPPRVAKTPNPLIERADETIARVESLHIEVVTKDEREARLRRLDLQSGVQRRHR